MSEIVDEWILKAEGDFVSALREYRATTRPNYYAAGFHAQQCIEKYMKAALQAQHIRFEKIHDLLALKELCVAFLPELELHLKALSYLSQFAVAYRYPGEAANREQAGRAVSFMKELRKILREKCGFGD